MLTHQVRTYSVHRETPKTNEVGSRTPKNLRKQNKNNGEQMALYILNRGRNAGKPLQEPCPNCFILYVRNQEELETYYWTFYAFWKHGFFHPHLCGSVIEMLRLCDLKTLMRNFIQPAFEKSCNSPEMVTKIKATWELEQKISQQAKALEELRHSLVRRYYLTIWKKKIRKSRIFLF